MVNVFGDIIASGLDGNLQVAKKVVTTVGRFGDYIDEIQQSYELGFTPYRLHATSDGAFLPPFVFIGGGYMYWAMLSRCSLPLDRLHQVMVVN